MAHLGDRVAAFVDGQLPPEEVDRVTAHLAGCEPCRAAVAQERALKRRMTGLGTAPTLPPALVSALADPARMSAGGTAEARTGVSGRLVYLFDHALARAAVAATGATAVLAVISYVVGAPHTPVDTVAPPVDRFVAQYRADADPVAQTVRSVHDPRTEVDVAVVPGAELAPTTQNSSEALTALSRVLGYSVSLRLLAHRYDLSLVPASGGQTEIVVSDDGRRVAAYVVDLAERRLDQVVRYAAPGATSRTADPLVRTVSTDLSSMPSRTASTGERPAVSVDTDSIDPDTVARLEASGGWACHDELADGAMTRVGARWVSLDGDKAIALTYSDGSSTVTVYEQSGALGASGPDGFRPAQLDGRTVWVRSGTPTVVTWDAGGIVFTVVGETADADLREVVRDLPAHETRTGMMQRIRTGMARISAWATPGSTSDAS